MNKNSINIIIGGDIVPTKNNLTAFETGNILEIISTDLLSFLKTGDLVFANLECPFTNNKISPIVKTGPNLRAPYKAMSSLAQMNISLAGLANNHIMDFDSLGLLDTIEAIKENNMNYLGAGKNLTEAAQSFTKDIKGVLFGFYTCAEHEFSIAGKESFGANPWDPLESYDHVRALSQLCDYTIVIYHGGIEHFEYGTPLLKKRLRKFADVGANLIVSQHSHCIGEFEDYNGAMILYGQGNFIFNGYVKSNMWSKGLLAKVSGSNKDDLDVTFIPIIEENSIIRMADSNTSEQILQDLNNRSKKKEQEKLLLFDNFCQTQKYQYLGGMKMWGRVLRGFDRRVKNILIKLSSNQKTKKEVYNYMQCEAHNEVCLNILKNYE